MVDDETISFLPVHRSRCYQLLFEFYSDVKPTRIPPAANAVAIIGAGPGGLAAAKHLKQQGFTPTIYEQPPSRRTVEC